MGKSRKFNSYREIGSKRQKIIPLGQALILTVVISFLFYRSFLGMLSGIVIFPFWLKLKKAERTELLRGKVQAEFKEFMMLIVVGLQTGYSMERAMKLAEEELKKIYPTESTIMEQVHIMNQKISMNIQVEKAFELFAKSIEVEEAISLAEVLSFAKRCGGDYVRHIRETAMKIEDNISVKQEIETITTEKRLELKVMCAMPLGILAYISLTSPGFIEPLYGNILGIILMTICLFAYGFFILLGQKIIDIKV